MSPYFTKSFVVLCSMVLLFAASHASADEKLIVTTPNPVVGDHVVVTAPNTAGDKKTLADTINFQAQNLSCEKDDDCRSIGFGNKACGGFQSYKIYSVKTLNEGDFKKLVHQYNEWEKEENKDNGMMSTCEAVLEPHVACLKGQCTAINSQFAPY